MRRIGPSKPLTWMRAPRLAAGGASLLLVVALGVAAVLTTSSASREAVAVHNGDRAKSQQILAGLTAQYLKFSALELSQSASSGRWSLTQGSSADTHRLRAIVAASPLFAYGAALVDLTGRPLSVAAQRPGLPQPRDPGYVPMIASLRSGTFGVSDVMHQGATPIVAMAVPISVAGNPRALLIGYTDARRWPLGVYTAQQVRFDPTASPYIVDGSDTIAAAASPSTIGRQIASPLADRTGGHGGLVRYSDHGRAFVATYSATGIGGWRAMTVEPATDFSGPLDRHANAVGIVLIALLAAAIGGLILLNLKRNQALRRLADDALYDQLTGLQSRRLFSIRLDAALTKQQRTRTHLGVLFSDLDGFKAINDRFGHATGDAALQEVARRLRANVRAEDSVARLGGDEFVVLLEDVDAPALADLATSLSQAATGPALLRGAPVDLHVSLGGVLVAADSSTSAAEIMHAADLAMYRAKSAGRVEISEFGEVAERLRGEGHVVELSSVRGTPA